MSKKHISLCIAVLAVLLGATPLLHARSAMQEQLYDVNLSMSGATVRSLTSELTRQMGILFSYETDLASRVLGDVSIRESKADMDAILNAAFAGSGISWKAVNRTVVLTADPQDLYFRADGIRRFPLRLRSLPRRLSSSSRSFPSKF